MLDLLLLTPPPGFDKRRQAKLLYWIGWRVVDIADVLQEKEPTVHSWKQRDGWDASTAIQRMEASLEARSIALIMKDKKSGGDFKEIDLLGRQMERAARIQKYMAGGHEGDLNPNVQERNERAGAAGAAKKKLAKNHFDEDQIEQLKAAFHEGLFDYQEHWWSQREQRTRVLLKARQIGATFYFAREALLKAVETGRNQVFLSASKAQAHLFRQYMVAFAREACGVELTGDPITLSNGAILYFLGTNARTAQGFHGDFYFDEFFWTFRFKQLNKVASAMATHKQWKKTYFSTPSSKQHEAYEFWTGEDRNKRRAKADRAALDLTADTLGRGSLGADNRYRHRVTVVDAEAGGCDLFDIEELQDEYSPAEFDNLFMCEFVDDELSVFPLSLIGPCMVDAWEEWVDYHPLAVRPMGNRPVWIGYDPSYSGDHAACIVAAPPTTPGGKFRLLEKFRWQGLDVAAQAEQIRELTTKYNVQYIGIDSTGMGIGVLQLVRAFFPTVTAINYSPETKIRMVLKALDTMQRKRIEFDHGWTDLAAAFMAIRQTMTASQRALTYEAGRTEETGHADLAWAAMHILLNEPLEAPTGHGSKSFMEIYG